MLNINGHILYEQEDIQDMINELKDPEKYDKFIKSLSCSHSDKRAITDVLYNGEVERFMYYDSDVSEIFISTYLKVFGKE